MQLCLLRYPGWPLRAFTHLYTGQAIADRAGLLTFWRTPLAWVSPRWPRRPRPAAITLWNTAYLDRALNALEEARSPVPPEYLPHISPLGWEHITLTGTYHWKGRQSPWGRFRPLRPDAIERYKATGA